MKRTKRTVSRKKRALRWLAVACVMLLWFNLQYHALYPLPCLTVRSYEQELGCGRTEILFRTLDRSTGRLVYLTANEHAMLLVKPESAWLGWQAYADVVDCSEEKVLRGGFDVLYQIDRWRESTESHLCVPYAYGRVDDPDIAEVQVTYRLLWSRDTNSDRVVDTVTCTASTYAEDWKDQGGSRYFLLRIEPQQREGMSVVFRGSTVTGLDAEGNVVAKYIVDPYR